MKKVVEGALYNTETARQIGSWESSWDTRDFNRVCETLYQTKARKYFLHGEGGGNSRYGVWHGNSGGPGEKIMPMTPDEAREWAEKHLDTSAYSAEFGVPDEASEDKETHGISVTPAIWAKLVRLSVARGRSISQIVSEMVDNAAE